MTGKDKYPLGAFIQGRTTALQVSGLTPEQSEWYDMKVQEGYKP